MLRAPNARTVGSPLKPHWVQAHPRAVGAWGWAGEMGASPSASLIVSSEACVHTPPLRHVDSPGCRIVPHTGQRGGPVGGVGGDNGCCGGCGGCGDCGGGSSGGDGGGDGSCHDDGSPRRSYTHGGPGARGWRRGESLSRSSFRMRARICPYSCISSGVIVS